MLTGIFILVMFGMVLALYFFGYVDRLYQMNSFGTEAVNQNTVYFVIKDVQMLDLSELAKGEIVKNATLLQHAPGSGVEYHVLYTQGSKDIFKGKQFTEWNFNSGVPMCVLGYSAAKRYESVAVLEHGNYPVHAVLDETVFIGFNSAVFYTDSMLSDLPVSGEIFAVASESRNNIRDSFQRLLEYLKDLGYQAEEITFSRVTFQDFLGYNDGLLLAFFGYFLFLFVIYLFLLFYWFRYKAVWCQIMWLFGEEWVKLRAVLYFCGIILAADIAGITIFLTAAKAMYFSRQVFFSGVLVVALIQLMAVILYSSISSICLKLGFLRK